MTTLIDKFIAKFPCACLLRGALERVLSPDKLNTIFEEHSTRQYTRIILFSTICNLLFDVVLKTYPSALKAYLENKDNIPVSHASFYNKINNMDTSVSQALLRVTSDDLSKVIDEFPQRPPILPGYSVRILDGNCIESSEKRLKVLRGSASAPLPGKSLVVFNPDKQLVCDVFPCPDGHAQERSLLQHVLPTIQSGQVWIADRNFCTQAFLSGIHEREAFFIIRKHSNLPITYYETSKEPAFVQKTSDGVKIYEHLVKVDKMEHVRLIRVELPRKTRNGDSFIEIVTNLPADVIAETISKLYRIRWKIETAFQHIEKNFNSEINTLAYPNAALFSFTLSLVAYNIFSLILFSIDAAHPVEPTPVIPEPVASNTQEDPNTDTPKEPIVSDTQKDIKPVSEQISSYYLAYAIASPFPILLAFEDEVDWSFISSLSTAEFAAWLRHVSTYINCNKLLKSKPRAPKKPRTKPVYDPSKPHVSTFRLLNGIK